MLHVLQGYKANNATKATTERASSHYQTATVDLMNVRGFVTAGLRWMAGIEQGSRCLTNQEAAAEELLDWRIFLILFYSLFFWL